MLNRNDATEMKQLVDPIIRSLGVDYTRMVVHMSCLSLYRRSASTTVTDSGYSCLFGDDLKSKVTSMSPYLFRADTGDMQS